MKQKVKEILKKFIQVKRTREIKRSSKAISSEKILEDLKNIGIEKGDILFLHSSLKSIGYVIGGSDAVVGAILKAIGHTGTLIVPTYSMKGTMFNTCLDEDFIFDPRTDTKGLSAIPNSVLKCDNVEISIHPTHCVSAIGKDAKFITEAHHKAESTFGKDSPWERFMRLNGKLFGLGVSMGPITFYHVLQDLEPDKYPLPVRMKKTYLLKCRNWKGEVIEVPVNPLDPKFTKFRIDNISRDDLREYFFKEFSEQKILRIGYIGMAKSWIASSKAFYDHLKNLRDEGITTYTFSEVLKKRPI
jgi:aminoglycoside N3'-acetyltransferase